MVINLKTIKKLSSYDYADLISMNFSKIVHEYVEYLIDGTFESYLDRLPILKSLVVEQQITDIKFWDDPERFLKEVLPRKIVMRLASKTVGQPSAMLIGAANLYVSNKEKFDEDIKATLETIKSDEFKENIKTARRNVMDLLDTWKEKVESIAEKHSHKDVVKSKKELKKADKEKAKVIKAKLKKKK